MRAIDRKMLRDLWHLRGQVVAIALVVASGVAVLIMSQSTQRSLLDTTAAYYERYAFADVFAHLTRAPERLAERIGAIDGVQAVQTRIVRYAMIDIPDFAEPVMGQFVSIPEDAQPRLNKLALRSGRLVQANRVDEVVVSEHFAEEHGLAPGSTLIAILNGNRRELDVVGIALSPEFIYSLGPGALMPDEKRFGIVWMGREALAGAFDLQESFNNVSLTLLRDASPEAVIQQLDVLLERYGGIGAVARKDQLSNWFVENEIQQLETISRLLPVIFLAVSAALTNMVLSRLIATERSQIGLMKAFGYSNVAVGWHYTKLVMVIAVLGALIGLVAGGFVGRLNTEMYAENFRFPFLYYRPSGAAFVVAAGLSVLAAVAGAAGSVFRAVRLPPAQAMLPPAPPLYRRGRLTESRVGRWLDQPTRIVLRNIARQPFRSAMTLAGVACCIALLIMALQWNDSLGYLARHHYYDVQHQHVTVGLTVPQEITVVQELGRMPAVQAAEAMRIVSVDLYAGHVAHRGAVTGVSDDAQLQPIYDDRSGGALPPPPEGIVLGSRLARKLGVAVGDRIWMHVLEGRRPWLQVTVASLVEVYIGVPAYMRLSTLNRLLRDRPKTEYVHLPVQSPLLGRVYQQMHVLGLRPVAQQPVQRRQTHVRRH
ncbi:MAG: ABC transporter permease, partial [Pseudomonadota bacterium]